MKIIDVNATAAALGMIDLKPGQIIAVGGKLYGRCADCLDLIRVDKWLFGSLHYCVPAKRKRGL